MTFNLKNRKQVIILLILTIILGTLNIVFADEDEEKITSVPKAVLKGFIAGCFDSDGCISLKQNRNYRSH